MQYAVIHFLLIKIFYSIKLSWFTCKNKKKSLSVFQVGLARILISFRFRKLAALLNRGGVSGHGGWQRLLPLFFFLAECDQDGWW